MTEIYQASILHTRVNGTKGFCILTKGNNESEQSFLKRVKRVASGMKIRKKHMKDQPPIITYEMIGDDDGR